MSTRIVDDSTACSRPTLSRAFGPVGLTLFGVGIIVGAGIFALTGQAAALYAGPAVALSFLIAGGVCAFAALCYAELSAMAPVAGAAYSFTRFAFGEAIGWMVGWALVAEMLFAACTVAVAWSAYVRDAAAMAGLKIPGALVAAPVTLDGGGLHMTGQAINLPAALMVAFISVFLYMGTKESARLNALIVSIKLSAVALFILFGLAYARGSNWVPFVPDAVIEAGGRSTFGIRGIFQAAAVVFVAFIGFDTVATAAQDTQRPQRNIPIAIFASLGISTLLYVGVSFAMTGLIDFHQLDTAAPLTTALMAAGPKLAWLKAYVGVAASIGLGSAALGMLFGLSRLLFSMARDGFLPRRVGAVHEPTGIPRAAVAIGGTMACAIAAILPINLLGELVSSGTLIAFTSVCAAAFALRLREPDRPRPFRMPWWPVTTLLGTICCLFLLLSMGVPVLLRVLAWQCLGAPAFILSFRLRRDRGPQTPALESMGNNR